MNSLFEIPLAVLQGQILLGIMNGSFYALLSLGLALIFGMLNVINFAHGSQYMLGAFFSWLLLQFLGIGFWWALLLSPLIVALIAVVLERTMLSRTYRMDHLNALLLTLGLSLITEGVVRYLFGNNSRAYPSPPQLGGVIDLDFMVVPIYRMFIVGCSLLLCLGIWWSVEKTRLGAYLRASTENPVLVQVFGINVPRLMTATYALGAGLAAIAGLLAAPVYQFSPMMGQDLIIVVFAIVVIGGVGSIKGAIVSSYVLGVIEALTKVVYPQAATVVVFAIMAFVLLVRPNGIFGKE